MEFGTWLKQKRKEKGWSQEKLAKEMEYVCKAGYISNLERNSYVGKHGNSTRPSLHIVDALANALNISVSEARLSAGYAPEKVLETDFSNQVLVLCNSTENWSKRKKEAFLEIVKKDIEFVNKFVDDVEKIPSKIKKANIIKHKDEEKVSDLATATSSK
jgi:transcriptional regulator with XRE-family HTH domain